MTIIRRWIVQLEEWLKRLLIATVVATISAQLTRFDSKVSFALSQIYSTLDRIFPQTTFRVTETITGFFLFEGSNLIMNLKNTGQRTVELKAKNRKGGPADPSSITGSYSATAATGAFTIEPDAANPLKVNVKGNPMSPGGAEDIGVVRFDGSRVASDGSTQPVTGEVAVNVTPGDADIIELEAGPETEQE
jgi:hypothetical protein